MADCEHSQHWSLDDCPGLTPEEVEIGEKIRSIGFTYAAGRDDFHGDHGTIRERTSEIMRNAKKYGNEPPEYVGPRSKMRPYAELAAE